VIFGGNVANGFVANIGLVKYISGTDVNPTTQSCRSVIASPCRIRLSAVRSKLGVNYENQKYVLVSFFVQ